MKFIKHRKVPHCKVSLILLDWGVRESFQILYYLGHQNISRDLFEVIVIEYYSRIAPVIAESSDQVDTWIVMEMPQTCYYHKHYMYNLGILASQGKIVVICDSDAMVKAGFISAILQRFADDPHIVLHLDQFRNLREDFYPFNYPDFDAVTGEGCINQTQGKTKGVVDLEDPLHTRNYGACMCAKRQDLIRIGGADEHIDYLGHICGPYDMTFRLVNLGLQEVWHDAEFLYHTWHPGQAGVDNYLGPHDGKHMSTTAMEALISKRVYPFEENNLIRQLRQNGGLEQDAVERFTTLAPWPPEWAMDSTGKYRFLPGGTHRSGYVQHYNGYRIVTENGLFFAIPLYPQTPADDQGLIARAALQSSSLKGLLNKIDRTSPQILFWINRIGRCGIFCGLFLMYALRWQPLSKKSASVFQKKTVRGPKLRTRLTQFMEQVNFLNQSMKDMIANLLLLKKNDRRPSAAVETILLIDRRISKIYLNVLISLGILPKLTIVILRNHAQAKKYLEDKLAVDQDFRLVLSRDLFIKHYALIALFRMHAKALII